MKQKLNLQDEILVKVLDNVLKKDIGSYVYIEPLTEVYGITDDDAIKILIILENESILEREFKLFCDECNSIVQDEEYEEDTEPYHLRDINCEKCGKLVATSDDFASKAIILFKVTGYGRD